MAVLTARKEDVTVTEPAPPSQPLLLSAPSAAKAMSIGQRKLWEITNCGDMPCVRIGRRVLYDPADLHAFIEKQKVVQL